MGVYADSSATVTAIWPEQPGTVTFHVIVRPPQTGMQACSFQVRMALAPLPPLAVQRQLGAGIEDLDPSDDGYDLRFAGGCLRGDAPVVLATYRFLTIEKSYGTVEVGPHGTESIYPPGPAYLPCSLPVELPLLPNPLVCEYAVPGSLEINGCAPISVYQEVYAGWLPPFAGRVGEQVTVPVRASQSSLLLKRSSPSCLGDIDQRIAAFTLEAVWDSTLASAIAIDPAPATRAWRMQASTAPGRLSITAATEGGPAVPADETPVAFITFRLADRSGCSGITTRLSTVRDEAGNSCPTGWLSSSFLIGCTKGDLTQDAEITAGDAVVALQLADGTVAADYAALCAGDIDGRFFLDEADADNVLRMSVGLPPSIESAPFGQLWKEPVATETVDLLVDQAFGVQASIQYDAAAVEFRGATSAGALVRARVVGPGVVHVALAARSAELRALRLWFSSTGAHAPARLIAVRGFDREGAEREVPYSFPDGVVAVDPAPSTLGVTRLLPSVPNPFNPRTTIRFVMGQPGEAELTVFDAAGRSVRRFPAARWDAGPHELTWDGRDDGARALASGVYFVRLETSHGASSRQKLVLLQ